MTKYVKVPKLDCPVCGCFMLHKTHKLGEYYVCPVCRSEFLPRIDRREIAKILRRP